MKQKTNPHVGTHFEDFLRAEGRFDEATTLAIKRVLACLEEINQSEVEITVSISLGSATAENPDQLGEALRLADSRMFYYKKRKKGQYT